VYILEQKRPEDQIGFLIPNNEKEVKLDDRFAIFNPLDIKAPRLVIPIGQVCRTGFHLTCLQIPEFYKDYKTYATKLVVAKIKAWKSTSYMPLGIFWRAINLTFLGKYVGILGEAGEIPAETEALLRQNKVDFREFSPAIMNALPKGTYIIPPEGQLFCLKR
jgi:exoribonuclease R